MEPIYVEIVPRRKFVNTEEFTAKDLNIFIESMEILARIERERQERRLRRRANKLNTPKLITEVELHSTPRPTTPITEDSSEPDDDYVQLSKPVCPKQLRCKLFASQPNVSMGHSSDENYFSDGSRSESPVESIDTDGIAVLPSTDSGTESESGIYQLRPRSFAMTTPKYRTTRARIIGLVLKKEYADGGSQDELEKQERRERVLEGLLREKEKCESLRAPSKETRKAVPAKQPTAEMRFIDKALRYLTL